MKKLKLERLNPPLLDRNISLQIGESFDVAANLLAENVNSCRVSLHFDEIAFEEITKNPNPWKFAGPRVEQTILWTLQGISVVSESKVRIDALANGLPQFSVFTAEVKP